VIYFEDMIVGQYMTSPAVVVDRDEMVDFAKRWDPLPIHVDSEVAASSVTTRCAFIILFAQAMWSTFATSSSRRVPPCPNRIEASSRFACHSSGGRGGHEPSRHDSRASESSTRQSAPARHNRNWVTRPSALLSRA